MDGESPFRVALVGVMVLNISIVVNHRLRARSGERISHREEGIAFAILLRLSGLGLWIAVFGYLLFPAYFQWAQAPLPTWLRWCGVATGLASAPLMIWTLSSLGHNLTDTVVTRKKATLVTCGPYRWVRHPFYVCAALLMFSCSLISASWLLAASTALVLVLLAARTPKEEAMLVARFGDAYRDYMARTGRYFPRLGRS